MKNSHNCDNGKWHLKKTEIVETRSWRYILIAVVRLYIVSNRIEKLISNGNRVRMTKVFNRNIFEVIYEEDKARFDNDSYFNPLTAVFFSSFSLFCFSVISLHEYFFRTRGICCLKTKRKLWVISLCRSRSYCCYCYCYYTTYCYFIVIIIIT